MGKLSSVRSALVDLFVRRRVSVATLGASLLIHAWIVLQVVLPPAAKGPDFSVELTTFLGLAAVLDIVIFAVVRVAAFRAVVLVRLCVVVIAHSILGTHDAILSVLLGATLFADIAVYDEGIVARLIAALSAGVLIGSPFLLNKGGEPWEVVSFAVGYALTIGPIACLAGVAMYYREQAADGAGRVSSLEQSVANLSDANKAFQLYADNIETESAEKERNRITGELHDTIGYALTNVIVMMKAGAILLEENPSALADVLKRVGEQSELALNDIRQTLHKMKAIQRAETKGLKAIHALTRAFQGATGVSVKVSYGNLPWTFGQRVDSVLFRLVQEGLTNAFRHGRASEVSVHFWQSAEEIRVTVRDNGRGSDAFSYKGDGIGLAGIRERLAELGGTLTARNRDVGFEIGAAIPYRVGEIGGTHQSTHS